MADPISPGSADALEETLGRLSKKVGVKAAIVVDRTSGAILKTSGQISSIGTSKHHSGLGPVAAVPSNQPAGSFALDNGAGQVDDIQGARELATLVWNFTKTAGSLVEEIDTEDELKLLRLRTKMQELVVVPGSKYLLIVIHDTPPA